MTEIQKINGAVYRTSNEVLSAVTNESTSCPVPMHFVNCTFTRLNLLSVPLSLCVFDACDLQHAILGVATGASFYSCDLRSMNAGHSDLRFAKALNCRSDGMILTGAQITLDCYFLSGLKSSKKSDGWVYLHWSALPDTPIQKYLLDLIPPEIRLIIEREFEREPRQI